MGVGVGYVGGVVVKSLNTFELHFATHWNIHSHIVDNCVRPCQRDQSEPNLTLTCEEAFA